MCVCVYLYIYPHKSICIYLSISIYIYITASTIGLPFLTQTRTRTNRERSVRVIFPLFITSSPPSSPFSGRGRSLSGPGTQTVYIQRGREHTRTGN